MSRAAVAGVAATYGANILTGHTDARWEAADSSCTMRSGCNDLACQHTARLRASR